MFLFLQTVNSPFVDIKFQNLVQAVITENVLITWIYDFYNNQDTLYKPIYMHCSAKGRGTKKYIPELYRQNICPYYVCSFSVLLLDIQM